MYLQSQCQARKPKGFLGWGLAPPDICVAVGQKSAPGCHTGRARLTHVATGPKTASVQLRRLGAWRWTAEGDDGATATAASPDQALELLRRQRGPFQAPRGPDLPSPAEATSRPSASTTAPQR